MTEGRAPKVVGEMRWTVARGLAVWLALSLVGVAVVALPDSGPRLASFSEGHGPSLMDAAGILVLLVGWLAFVVALWNRRSAIGHRSILGTLAVVGAAVVAWSVATDTGLWWVLGIVLLLVAQVAAGLSAIRRVGVRHE
jgi:hypothetical protein